MDEDDNFETVRVFCDKAKYLKDILRKDFMKEGGILDLPQENEQSEEKRDKTKMVKKEDVLHKKPIIEEEAHK